MVPDAYLHTAHDHPAEHKRRAVRPLFVCELQQSDNPTANMVAEASPAPCSGSEPWLRRPDAQEFGDHPDTARDRMRWVRQLAPGGLPDARSRSPASTW